MLRKALFLILFALSGFISNAFHIVGGDLTYKCLGNNNYEITMIVYRDCNSDGAEYDNPANIAIYNDTLFANLQIAPTGIRELPADIYDPCFSVPSGVCVQIGYYKTIVYLPPNMDGYTVSYQRCCRNKSLKNIRIPDKVGTTITTNITGSLRYGCNNSPIFKSSPPIAICLGSEFNFNHSARDDDGDSLVYKFCDPYSGGSDAVRNPGPPNSIMPIPATKPPYNVVPWSAGYSATNPFNIVNPFQIDPITGQITGIPIQTGQYLYGICVDEYRNGIKIGETRREFQVNIVPCESNTEAKFVAPLPCSGMKHEMVNNSITSRTFQWDFDLDNPGILTSTLKTPTFTFPDTGTYKIRLIANPQFDCADTIEKLVQVYPPINPEVLGYQYACLSNPVFKFSTTGEYEPYTRIYWTFGQGASIRADTGEVTQEFNYPQLGAFDMTVILTHAVCSAEVELTPSVIANPELKLETRNTEGCAPLLVQLENLSVSESPLVTNWALTNTLRSSSTSTNAKERWRFDKPGNYNISFISYTQDKCIDTLGPVDISIKVYESPSAGFTLSDTLVSIFSPEVEVFSNPKRASDCDLFVGSLEPENGCSGLFLFDKPGVYRISQLVANENGCTDTLSKTVKVENEYAFFAPNSFTPNTDGRNEEFRPVVIGAKEYQLTIHDRWGHIIFTSNDPKIGWDGTNLIKQEMASIGVYLYQARVMDYLDEFHFYSGEVNLFR